MSIDNIGSYYTNNVEPRSVRTVIVNAGAYQGTSPFTAAYTGLFGAGSLITNITSAPAGTLAGDTQIYANGMCSSLVAPGAYIVQFMNGTFNTVNGVGSQGGVTLPQDSWLVASGTGTAPPLVVSYLS